MLAKTLQLLHSVLGGTLKRTWHSGHVWLLVVVAAVLELAPLVKEGETRTMGVDGFGLCVPVGGGGKGRQRCSSERRLNMVGRLGGGGCN